MANIGVFIERYTITRSEEMGAIMRLGHVAERLGHRVDVLFRPDMYKIPSYDALFIRSLTDPLNFAFVASRMAEMHGLRVIDDPDSIIICCDKVNMYRHLQFREVPMPDTEFLGQGEVTLDRGQQVLNAILNFPDRTASLHRDTILRYTNYMIALRCCQPPPTTLGFTSI
jgi:glutathione synthase/RimK-type ligase-like ATP-grasp enzyme